MRCRRGIIDQIFKRIGEIWKNDQIWCAKMTYRNQNTEVKGEFLYPQEWGACIRSINI